MLTNRFDFFVRNLLRWRLPGGVSDSPVDRRLGAEVAQWLGGFDWRAVLGNREPRIVDVGAKNFFLAPALDALLRSRGFDPELHGIEIDAFRRYGNLRTRADYGEHYAASIANGRFHAMDFLQWRRPLDAVLLLNPFVTEFPLLAWGLPRGCFRPRDIFGHAYHLLRERNGVLVVCSPDEEELELSLKLAVEAGFTLRQRHDWHPRSGTLQERPRLGALLFIER